MHKDSLLLYRNRPARVNQVGDKLEIELEDGKTLKVRPKDVTLLHPGPIRSLGDLTPLEGEVETAWELLAGQVTSLAELAELIYEHYSPASAWATWLHIEDGLYFRGTPDAVVVCLPEQVAQEQAARVTKAAEKEAWSDFLERVRKKQIISDDSRYLVEVEQVAFKRQDKSRVLRELGYAESAESAHALLLELGYWDVRVDPYPQRLGLATTAPQVSLSRLPDEPRLDLTHLPAFAIDDAGSDDPDDALSLERNRSTCVHLHKTF